MGSYEPIETIITSALQSNERSIGGDIMLVYYITTSTAATLALLSIKKNEGKCKLLGAEYIKFSITCSLGGGGVGGGLGFRVRTILKLQ